MRRSHTAAGENLGRNSTAAPTACAQYKRIDDAVHVVQRQRVQYPVAGLPLPRRDQRPDMRGQVGMRVQRPCACTIPSSLTGQGQHDTCRTLHKRTLWVASRAARVHNECAILIPDGRQPLRCTWQSRPSHVIIHDMQSRAGRRRDGRHARLQVARGQDC